jgi:hypothetical protein
LPPSPDLEEVCILLYSMICCDQFIFTSCRRLRMETIIVIQLFFSIVSIAHYSLQNVLGIDLRIVVFLVQPRVPYVEK